jgi:hypothetical protein
MHTYINDEMITYVVILTVVSRGNVEVMKLIAVSIALESKEL